GDRDAYHRLLRGVLPWLRGFARQALRDATEAEDAVQDTLLTLHAMRHAYDPRRPFRPWLAGIARHRIADRRRGRARRLAREMALDPADETFAAATPNEGVEMGDVPAMHRALAGLSAGQRQAIELLKLKEMSLQEAAAVSGMTVGALKVATHRGLMRLRALLAGAAG
ncbi:MAG: sigma-70 family RNA polymerase sigma factor, partial [Rhodospirillales bacterium]|nr:sigma-70 family RNA polymerase sigma factor [Rhodospirillales bacterium]